MKNLEFSEILNSLSYNVSDFETKDNNWSEFGPEKDYCNRFRKHNFFLSVKFCCKIFDNLPDLNWGLQKREIWNWRKESGKISVRNFARRQILISNF